MLKLLKSYIPNILKRNLKLFIRNCCDSILYYLFQKGKVQQSKPKSIIFICKGNICRSAFAEYYMRAKASKIDIKIDSFGLDVDQGKFSPPQAVETALKLGIDLSENVSKKLSQADIEKADLIIPMEYSQYKRTVAMFPEKKESIQLLREYAPFPASLFCNIDDPFGWGKREFITSFTLIQKAIDNLCNDLNESPPAELKTSVGLRNAN